MSCSGQQKPAPPKKLLDKKFSHAPKQKLVCSPRREVGDREVKAKRPSEAAHCRGCKLLRWQRWQKLHIAEVAKVGEVAEVAEVASC